MRLIDADSLLKCDCKGTFSECDICVDSDLCSRLNEAPTVKAIPIDVIDKISAELHATAEMHEDGAYYLREEWIDEIINKYKAEGISDKE